MVVNLLLLRWVDWEGGSRCSRLSLNWCNWLWLGFFPHQLLLLNLCPLFLTDRSFCCLVVAEVSNDCRSWLPYLLRGLLQLRLMHALLVQAAFISARILVRIPGLLSLSIRILIDEVLSLWGTLFLRQNALDIKRFLGCFYRESIHSNKFLMGPVNSFTNQGQRSVQTLSVACAKTGKFESKRC